MALLKRSNGVTYKQPKGGLTLGYNKISTQKNESPAMEVPLSDQLLRKLLSIREYRYLINIHKAAQEKKQSIGYKATVSRKHPEQWSTLMNERILREVKKILAESDDNPDKQEVSNLKPATRSRQQKNSRASTKNRKYVTSEPLRRSRLPRAVFKKGQKDDWEIAPPKYEATPRNYDNGFSKFGRYENGYGSRPDFTRYESSSMDYEDTVPVFNNPPNKTSKRGRLITFYKNGDELFKGCAVSVSQKLFITFEALLDYLNQKIPTTKGVRSIFSWPEGKLITNVKDFQAGCSYVASDSNRLNDQINYGDIKPKVWVNKKPSASKVRHTENGLFRLPGQDGGFSISGNTKPRVLTIVSNTDRSSREKVILNPQTNQQFEEVLEDIGSMVYIKNPPVTALYTAKKPHRKVLSFSQLFKDFREHEAFIACGREQYPVDRREAPQSTQSDSAINVKPTINRKTRGKRLQKEYESDFDELPTQMRKPMAGTSLFNRVMPPAPQRSQLRPPLSPDPPNRAKNRINHKTTRNFETVRIDIHSQRREFYSPSNAQPSDGGKPDRNLQLDWVYGYRGRDARNNLHVLPSGELLYYVASVAVMFDRKKDVQRHYLGHNEDITSMVLHPNQFCVATGQAAGNKRADSSAHIRVWDASSLATYAIIGFGMFHVAVGSLAFSIESEGQYLMAIDESERHILSVWSWQEEKMIVKTTLIHDDDFRKFGTSVDTVVWGTFHPFDDRIIVTHGKQHIYFWKIFHDGSSPTRLLRDKLSGVFDDEIPKFVTSVCFTQEGDCVSGDSNGSILVWSQDDTGAFSINRRISNNLRHVHKKSVFALHITSSGILISGGGHEVKTWDCRAQYRQRENKKIPETAGFVRTLAARKVQGAEVQLCIGTTKNCILEGAMTEKFRYLVQGHSEELWALATHPEEHSFITAGYDQQVCKWSAVSHKLIWKTYVDKPCLSVAFDPRGELVAIGTAEGRFVVLDAHTGTHMSSTQVANGAVDSVQVSPDGRMLAMGTQDGSIFIYDIIDGGQFFRKHKEGVLRGHRNLVIQLDWSTDSQFLQSVSGDYDLLYWDVYSMSQERDPRSMRDVDWHTQTCVLGYSTAGAWSHLEDEDDDIDTVCKSNYEDYLAVGDNQGALRLYKYPASSQKPGYYEKNMYSSHVSNVRFIFDDSYIITTGGIDAGLLQWSLVETATPRDVQY